MEDNKEIDTKTNKETDTGSKSKKKLPFGAKVVSAVGSALIVVATIIGAVFGS